jgi:hypothetical protein
MKKIFIILALLVITLTSFTQTIPANFHGEASVIRKRELVKETEKLGDWSKWDSISGIIVIYVDWMFGNVTVTNQEFQRFILIQQVNSSEIDENIQIMIFKAVDNNGLISEIDFTFNKGGVFILTVVYSNVVYQYKLLKITEGYPIYLREKAKKALEDEKKANTEINM